MRMVKSILAGVVVVTGVLACDEPLGVDNTNNPDVNRAFSTPAGIERIIGTTFQLIQIGNHGSNTAIKSQLFNMAFESYASVANNGMAVRAALPRLAIQNTRGNQTATENFRDFAHLQRAARLAANAIAAVDSLKARSRSLGTAAQDARGRAFAFFSNGVAVGNVALAYDSAAIITPELQFGSTEVLPLSGYSDVMDAALALLDSAIANAAGMGTLALPSSWINGNAMTSAEFVRFVRSYKARFRAGVARTPAERDDADWDAILADAQNGVTADVNITLSPSANWTNAWIGQHHIFQGWHQVPYFFLGMADTARAYDAWLATPLNQREPFLVRTPDRRLPSGATRAAQQTNSPASPSGVLYFRNRASGGDTPGEPWGTSFYDHYRFIPIFNAANNGPWPIMTKAEIDMLAAEGHIRSGNFAAAAALIDVYRTRAGLPVLGTSITSLSDPVPGGNACVPRVPQPPSFTTTACGNIMEAMKWEKRMETAFTGWGQWYFDSRGWGDLPEGTALHYPVPFQEMDARGLPFYNLGGVGGDDSAAKGTYGF
jgi:hypothetical protein